MKSPYIVSNAGAAWDELGRWGMTIKRQQQRAEVIKQERPKAKVVFLPDDPALPGYEYPDHAERIHAHARNVIETHLYLTSRQDDRMTQEERQHHVEAIAAWRLVLRERNLHEMESRIRVAITASGKTISRCADIVKTPPREA
jgi:hypothetical protein